MSRRYTNHLDPQLPDGDPLWDGYDPAGEPLEDRLYLPCGVDPHGDICGVCFVHPYPQGKEVLCQKIIQNNDLQDMLWLIATGDGLAARYAAVPVYVFESTSIFWRAQRNFLHRAGYATATVCGRQTNHARGTVTRKTHNDLKDAYNIAKVFKQGESHASHILPEPLAALREYCRLHEFLTSYSVAIQNRRHCIRYAVFPEFDGLFSKSLGATSLALMQHELLLPYHLLHADLQDLTDLIRTASHGKLGREKTEAFRLAAVLAKQAGHISRPHMRRQANPSASVFWRRPTNTSTPNSCRRCTRVSWLSCRRTISLSTTISTKSLSSDPSSSVLS